MTFKISHSDIDETETSYWIVIDREVRIGDHFTVLGEL